jgi:hypothetical protein
VCEDTKDKSGDSGACGGGGDDNNELDSQASGDSANFCQEQRIEVQMVRQRTS